MRKLIVFLLCLAILPLAARAQDDGGLAPPEITGEAVYIPFPVDITLDGDLSDWAEVPAQTVDRGTMTSDDPAENGSFTFGVAADMEMLYIYMTMPDQNIITGQHGANFWNEDSFEFYLNSSSDLNASSYGEGIFQININAGDIGNTDPTTVTLTGTRSETSGTQAFVFATEDGWGFEAAVPLTVTPAHGLEIGFQAHANGASEADRDVKLIWSVYDEQDQSWQNPSVFGSGIFFEVGQTDVPLPTQRGGGEEEVVMEDVEPLVSLNQVGYLPEAPKFAAYPSSVEDSLPWSLVDAESDETVFEGTSSGGFMDEASGQMIHVADFSAFQEPGTYKLVFDGVESQSFSISADIYDELAFDAMRYFYLNRSGIELEAAYAGEDYARPAGHVSDNDVTCYEGTDGDGVTWDGCDYWLDAGGGWYDAGDYGKYVVNGGISVWTLLNLYERNPDIFTDGTLNIPESGNGVADILDEVRWELEFFLGMQVPEGEPLAGMVHHKLHGLQWDGMPTLPETDVDNTNQGEGRFLMPPSTAATLNMAATTAQCARIWREIDPDFADQCLAASVRAWEAANNNPIMLAGNTPGNGGGNYGDGQVNDEFFWAAAELYITTGESVYYDYLTDSNYFRAFGGTMWWGNTAALGTISLATVPNDLSEAELETVRDQIITAADRLLVTIEGEGYRVPLLPSGYDWGSNSSVLNNAILLALAYDLTDDRQYLDGVLDGMNYLLGMNGLGISFVSGYGDNAMQHPHHRFWYNEPELGYPAPPPGVVAGGPNRSPSDPAAEAAELDARSGPALRYVDDAGSWSTNEVTINWNAPLTWVAAFLHDVTN